ncbi:type IV pilus inner membrane component PilO [Oceanisphaera avium]|uniref:Pilus assembly protein PilO n=1 Tax=Oceanisphaera avium TaxID=1903694 RepID=A0A1Y0D0Z2_9GAMM|nr:type 4a pilus biogenesis protein PilO [Oceanisphaera avium]ART80954.1 hypothetical protein CBP12_12970 [Oceanisphaera avium]
MIRGLQELELSHVASWPWPAKLMLLSMVGMLVYGVAHYGLVKEPRQQWQQVKSHQQVLNHKLKMQQAQAKQLTSESLSSASFAAQLIFVEQSLPKQKQTAVLLEKLSHVAAQEGVILQGIQWQGEQVLTQVTALPLQLTALGNYAQLGHFIAALVAFPRLLEIEQLAIQGEPQSTNHQQRLSLKVSARAYVDSQGVMP